jgi:hypothetical protein
LADLYCVANGGDPLEIITFKEIEIIMMTQQEFVSELSKLRPAATFLSLLGYRNESSEIADYSVIFHMSYANALKRSLVALESIVPDNDLEATAKQQLMASYQTSLDKIETTPMEELEDHYTHFLDENNHYIKGVKMHNVTGILHLYGLVAHKRVLMPGVYKKVNHRPLTIAKNKLAKLTPCGKFRQFKITPAQVDRIAVENMSLLPPNAE